LPVSFICLRFKRVDNLGAYSIPSETGLLIPSGYDSYRSTHNSQVDAYASGLTQIVLSISSYFAP
jgi:hypothetical protein